MPADECRVCDHPQATHGRRYTAGYGEHDWMRPRDTRPVHERASGSTEEREWTPGQPWPLPGALNYGRTRS